MKRNCENPTCQNEFEPRTAGGKPQRFCSVICRRVFEKSVRAAGLAAIKRTAAR
jgi:hypothetical protein